MNDREGDSEDDKVELQSDGEAPMKMTVKMTTMSNFKSENVCFKKTSCFIILNRRFSAQ
jgi:hypothetical protein